MTSYALKQQLTNLLLTSGAAVLAAYGNFSGSFGLLIFAYIFINFFMSFIFVSRNWKQPGVPFNVYFIIKRFGEFTMLMLGEGVLQIIILPISDNVSFHLVLFFLAYLILNSLEFVKFYMVPDTPETHVLTKSTWRSPFVLLIYPFLFSSFICVGIGLKLVLSEEDEEINERVSGFLSFSLTASTFFLILKNIIHLGLYDIFFRTNFYKDATAKRSIYHLYGECSKEENLRIERIAFTFFFFGVSFLFLLLANLELNGQNLLGVALLFIVLIFFISVFERKLFDDVEMTRVRGISAAEDLDLLLQPVYETELFNMNELWKKAFEEKDPEAKETFEEELEKRKEQLHYMMNYMKAHSNFLSEKIGRTHVHTSSLEKAKRFLDEVKELRELTDLVEENLYFLFSQHMQDLNPPIARANTRSQGGLGANSFTRGPGFLSGNMRNVNMMAEIEPKMTEEEDEDSVKGAEDVKEEDKDEDDL